MTPGLSPARPLRPPGGREALAEALERSPDSTAWVDCYTDDAIFVGPGAPAIEGRSAFLEAAPHLHMSSVEIVAESTLGAGDFAAFSGARLAERPRRIGCSRVRRRFLMVWRREPDGRWRRYVGAGGRGGLFRGRAELR